MGGANRVDEGGLAVVDVAHDGHDRGARFQIRGVVFHLNIFEMGGVHRFFFSEIVIELKADRADGLIVQDLVDRDGFALQEKELDDAWNRDVDGFGKVSHAEGLGIDENASVDLRLLRSFVVRAVLEVADALGMVIVLLLEILFLHILPLLQ